MRRFVPVLAMLSACGTESRDPLRFEVPVRPEHRAVVIAFEHAAALEVIAQAIDMGAIAPLERPLEEDVRVTVLLYTHTLDEMGMREGALELSEGGQPLPEADLTLEAHPLPGTKASWSEVQRRSAAVDAFRIATPCRSFSPQTLELGASPAVFSVGVAGDGVLIGSEDGSLHIFAGAERKATLTPNARFKTAMRDPLDARVVWFGAAGGEIWRGEVDAVLSSIDFTRTSTLGSQDDVLFLDGDPSSDLFAQLSGRQVFHFDGVRWSFLGVIDGRGRATGIARIGDGVALSAWADCLCVIEHHFDGRSTEINVPANSITSNGISALVHDPQYGTISGSFIGEIFEARERPDAWTKIEGTYSTLKVTSIARYGDGFVYSDQRGVAVQYVPSFGYCDVLPAEQPRDRAGFVARAGDDVVIASDVVTWWMAAP